MEEPGWDWSLHFAEAPDGVCRHDQEGALFSSPVCQALGQVPGMQQGQAGWTLG